jgi:hypothetical protein
MGSEGRQVLAEVVEQIRLRRMGFERLIVAIQLVAIVILECRSQRIEELEELGDVLIGELGRFGEPQRGDRHGMAPVVVEIQADFLGLLEGAPKVSR